MTSVELVDKVMSSEHADVIRESVAWVAAEIMEAEVAAQVGAELGEISEERVTQRNGYRPRRWDTRAGKSSCASRSCAPGRTFRASWSRAGGPSWRSWRSSRRHTSTAYRRGRSTVFVEQLGIASMSKDQVSRLCRGLDEQVQTFRERPPEGRYPYVWLDGKIERVREHGGREPDPIAGALLIEQSDEWLVSLRCGAVLISLSALRSAQSVRGSRLGCVRNVLLARAIRR